jgi:hypothetical protein
MQTDEISVRRGWLHASIFGDGDRTPLNAGQLAAWKWRVRAAGAAGRLNANGLAVADALASYLGPDGRLDPSYEAIAERCRQRGVRLARRTLARCLVRLRELGALSWQRRLARAGRHVWQTSNAYCLRLAATVQQLLPKPLKSRNPTSRAVVALGPCVLLPDRAEALAALAARRAAPGRPVLATPVRRNAAGFIVYGPPGPA